MANPDFFKKEFERYATNGFLGDPNGESAYGYLRVSSKGQAEEGRSGLPRQIEHIHEKALTEHYKISWDMIFADDHTGFEFQDRPQLQLLLKELKTNTRRANAIFFENIDRLSRNAEWHQGYLLEQLMKKLNTKTFFWKDLGNRITRMVLGVVAQDGMEDSKERMRIGTLKKLEDGRITSKRPAYGFQFVDSYGNANGKWRRDTHYGIFEEEAKVVRIIYLRVADQGISITQLCTELNNLYKPPKNCSWWQPQIVSRLIKNEVYKGWFIGNKYKTIVTEQIKSKGKLTNEHPKMKKMQILRPEEEWKRVSVPRIVSDDLWERANNMIEKNSTMSSRNSKNQYLLTGLIKCAACGRTYVGNTVTSRNTPKGKKFISTIYRCSSRNAPKVIRDALQCNQGVIHAIKIEDAIWKIICNVLVDPDPMLKALEAIYNNEETENILSQVNHIKNQISACEIEDARVKKGYNAGVYTEDEAIEQREEIRTKKLSLQSTLEKIENKLMTQEQFLAQKEMILELSKSFRAKRLGKNAPFELKRATVKTVIDQIILNTNAQSFEVSGIIHGSWNLLDDGSDDNDSNSNDIASRYANRTLRNIEWKIQFYFDKPLSTSLFIVTSDGKSTPSVFKTSNI